MYYLFYYIFYRLYETLRLLRLLRLSSSLFPLSLAISLRSTFARSLAIWKKVAIVIPPLFPFMQLS